MIITLRYAHRYWNVFEKVPRRAECFRAGFCTGIGPTITVRQESVTGVGTRGETSSVGL